MAGSPGARGTFIVHGSFVSRAVRTRWDSSRARTNAIRLHWWRGLRSCEREARVYPGVRRVRGSRRCARAPPTAAADYWGACDHGAGGHPGWARPQRAGPVVPGFTRPGPAARARRRRRHQAEDLDALFSEHLHARHAGSPGPGIGVRLLAEAGSDQRQSAALVARTAQLRARSASLPRGAQGAGQPEVRARPPGSFCRPAALTRHRRRH